MATVKELKDALQSSLSERGVLSEVRTRLLSSIYDTLNTNSGQDSDAVHDTSPLLDNKVLIYELLLEFLSFEHLNFTQSVFRSETSYNDRSLTRRNLSEVLRIRPTVSVNALVDAKETDKHPTPNNKPVPLLYYLVDWLKNRPDPVDLMDKDVIGGQLFQFKRRGAQEEEQERDSTSYTGTSD